MRLCCDLSCLCYCLGKLGEEQTELAKVRCVVFGIAGDVAAGYSNHANCFQVKRLRKAGVRTIMVAEAVVGETKFVYYSTDSSTDDQIDHPS